MKVLYYYSKLGIGGAERSTVRLMNAFAKQGHEVTLLLRWSGELEKELLSGIQVIHLKKTHAFLRKLGFVGTTFNHLLGLVRIVFVKVFVLPIKRYDIVINGLLGYDPKILFECVKGNVYYQMLRNDVSATRHYGKTERYMEAYGDKFDYYIGVSKYVTESFKKEYPVLSERAHTIYNILPDIKEKENEECPEEMKGNENILKILTVCRLEEKSKGLMRMADVAKTLCEKFPNKFKWFIVGDGPDRKMLQEKIAEYGIEDYLIMCGLCNNPLPYYQHCDFVAVLSYYEGLCGVVNEAKLMNKPVLATQFSGIGEQIENGVNGIVVENSEEKILKKMIEIIEGAIRIEKFAFNGMPKEILDNTQKVKRFISFAEAERR